MDTVSYLLGLGTEGYRGVFEGDDSLTSWPSWVTQDMILTALGKLGVAAEMAHHENAGSAGYCSTYWNEDYELICDPVKVCATFPFTTSQLGQPKNYAALLSAKAMSLAYRAPGCPVLSAIVRRYIQPTGLMETRNLYERQWFSQFGHMVRPSNRSRASVSSNTVQFDRWDLIKEPTSRQRAQFERVFGISAVDQIGAERSILKDDGFSLELAAYLSTVNGAQMDKMMAVYSEMRYHKSARL